MKHFLACILAFGAALTASAQQLDHPVEIPVSFYGHGVSTTSTSENSSVTVQITAATGGTSTGAGSTATGPYGNTMDFDSPTVQAQILPGKEYDVHVSSVNCTSGTVTAHFAPTPGQAIYINGIQQQSYNGGGTSYDFHLRVEYVGDPTSSIPGGDSLANQRAGACTSFPEDKAIFYIGLGRLSDGRFAGAVGFRRDDTIATLANVNSLLYDSIDPSYVTVTRDANGYPTQISASQIVLMIDAWSQNQTSYHIRGYAPSDLTHPTVDYLISAATVAGWSGIRVDRTEDGCNWATAILMSGTNYKRYDWQRLATNSTAFDENSATTTTVNGSNRTVQYGVSSDATSTTKLKVLDGNDELTTETWGPSMADPQTTTYSYGTTATGNSWPGAVMTETQPSGNWTRYDYYDQPNQAGAPGTVLRMYQPFTDSPATWSGATTTSGYVETYQYTGNYDGNRTAISDRDVRINGSQVGHTTWSYNWSAGTANGHTYAQVAESDYGDSSNALVTTTRSFRPDDSTTWLRGKPYSITYPTGRKDSFAYFAGSWDAGTHTFTAGSGNAVMALAYHGQVSGGTNVSSASSGSSTWTLDGLSMVAGYSTVSTTVTDSGHLVFSGESAYSGSGLTLVSGTQYTYDAHNRISNETDVIRNTTVQHSFEAATAGDYSFMEKIVGVDGVQSMKLYDALLRPYATIEGAGKPTGVVAGTSNNSYRARATVTTYGVAGLVRSTSDGILSATPSGGTSGLGAVNPIYYDNDAAGRVIEVHAKSPADSADLAVGNLVTHYSFPSALSTTTKLPSGATSTVAYYLDGRRKSVSGTAQPSQYWTYAVNGPGLQVTQTANGSDLNAGGTIVQYDWLNRPKLQTTPAYGYNTSSASTNLIDVTSTYDSSTGLLTKQHTIYRATNTQLIPDTLYVYDNGRLTKQGQDVNGDGQLTAASNDRFTEHDDKLSQSGTNWQAESDVYTYGVLNDATRTVVSQTTSQLTGFGNGTVAVVATTDATGRVTTQTTTVDATNLLVTTATSITGISSQSQTTTYNGYTAYGQAFSGEQWKRTYDADCRLAEIYTRGSGSYGNATFPSGAVDTYQYYGDTTFFSATSIAGVATGYSYAWSGTGTRTVTKNSNQAFTTYVLYNSLDLPMHIGGAGTSATAFGYDAYGRRTSVTTYRDGTHTEADWPSTGDTTQWILDSATGLPNYKQFADYTSSNNKQVGYTYTPLGQLKTRTWARGITTTYSYFDGTGQNATDVSNRTQELHQVTYSDGVTPGVTYAYKRTGLPDTVADAAGTRTFAYRSNALQLNTESFDSSFFGSRVIQRQYDSASRDKGFTVGSELSQQGSYVAASGTFDYLDSSRNNGTAVRYSYNYKASSALIGGYTSGNFSAVYDYDNTSAARRIRIEGDWSGAARTRFDLQFDARGFLHTAKQSGTAFQDYYSGTSYSSVYNYYVYDNRGQLKTAIMYRGVPPADVNTAPASADELPGRRFNYGYDGAGNRTKTGPVDPADTGNPAYGLDEAFSPNALNQYDSRENKLVHVLGTVTSGASMSASSSGTTGGSIAFTMLDRSFSADAVPANSGGVVKGTMSLTGSLSGSSQSASRDWLAAPATQVFTYDSDGNLTADGLWQYTYDAENRLTQMSSLLPTGQGYTRLQLVFKYDYLGRRIQKTVTNLDTSATTFSRRFLYDGWNLIAELDSTGGSIQRSYTWGLDVAGTFTATGGVGALLQITDWTTNTTYLPTYDGNGNVSSLINAADGTVAATYEYSPFGELLRRQEPASGGYAKLNPFRFSTKYTDEETGLVYYGHRYYSPSLGRFINRDPIEEAGGVNLYAMCGNNAVGALDVLGNNLLDWLQGRSYNGTSEWNNNPNASDSGKEDHGVSKTSSDTVVINGKVYHTAQADQLPEGATVVGKLTTDANGALTFVSNAQMMDPFEVNGSAWDVIGERSLESAIRASNNGDAFSVGGNSVGTTTGFTQKDYNDALALLKATKPGYYKQVIGKLKLSTYKGATDKTKAYSGYSNVKAGTVSINLDSTVAAQLFSGTAAEFLALVILHESTHIEYYREGFRTNPGASPAMEEASIRYWVEDWAIKNGIPQTVPNGRSGTGFFGKNPPFTPNFSSIYDGVVNDGYSTDPF